MGDAREGYSPVEIKRSRDKIVHLRERRGFPARKVLTTQKWKGLFIYEP